MRAEFEHDDDDEDKDRPDLEEGLGMILEGAGLVGKIIVEVRPWNDSKRSGRDVKDYCQGKALE